MTSLSQNGLRYFPQAVRIWFNIHAYHSERNPTVISRLNDDVIKWKHFPRYWPFVRGIHRSPVNSPHKGQWRGALMFSLIYARIDGWVNNREAGDLRRHHAHHDVTVMISGYAFGEVGGTPRTIWFGSTFPITTQPIPCIKFWQMGNRNITFKFFNFPTFGLSSPQQETQQLRFISSIYIYDDIVAPVTAREHGFKHQMLSYRQACHRSRLCHCLRIPGFKLYSLFCFRGPQS